MARHQGEALAILTLVVGACAGTGAVLVRPAPPGVRLVSRLAPEAAPGGPRARWSFAVARDGGRVLLEQADGSLATLETESQGAARPLGGPLGPGPRPALDALLLLDDGAVVFEDRVESPEATCGRFLRVYCPEPGVTFDLDRGRDGGAPGLVALLPSGRLLAAEAGGLTAWDPRTGAQGLCSERVRTASRARAISLSADGGLAATVHERTIVVWDVAPGRKARVLETGASTPVAVALLPGGNEALVGEASGLLRVVDLESGETRASRELGAGLAAFGALDVSRDPSQSEALAVGADGVVRLLDVPSLVELDRIPAPPGASRAVRAVFRSGTEEVLVSRGPGSLERWSCPRAR